MASTVTTSAPRKRSKRSQYLSKDIAGAMLVVTPVSGCAENGRLQPADVRTQKTNVVYAISDKPMFDKEWSKRYVTPH